MDQPKLQPQFLQRANSLTALRQLLDLLPDVGFYMKDEQGRFILHNRHACDCCRAPSEQDTVGKTDYDFFPKERAAVYAELDRMVLISGKPIINAIELAPEASGSDRLIIYSKVPVLDHHGAVIGVAGVYRYTDKKGPQSAAFGRLARAVEYVHAHFGEPLRTAQLSRYAGLSTSQFDRLFRKLFHCSLRQYLNRIRVQAACHYLAKTDQTVTQVALITGFFDHAHFTRNFIKQVGISPAKFRKSHNQLTKSP